MNYKRLVALFFVFSLNVALFSAPNSRVPKSLIRVEPLTIEQVREFFSKKFDIPKVGKNYIEVVVSTSQRQLLEKKGFGVKTIIPDLDEYVSQRIKSQSRDVAYYTYETMTSKLKGWAESFSNIASLSSLGQSIDGREIWAMKVSDNPGIDEKEPAALIMGAHHAREWISVEVPMEALKQYLEGYGSNEKITQMVNEREVWFVPMVNPDGITYSQNNSRYWRKNRRKVDNRNFGVDLNRNYSYKWGLTGASNSPSSDVYHGTGPFSEPETTAIKNLVEKQRFQASISFHSYSELILYPFGYAYNVPCNDTPILSKLAGEMAKFNDYTPENSADLYPAMGDSDDWLYGDNKTLAFTFELASQFIPPAQDIVNINKINVPAVFHLIDKSGTYALSTPSGDSTLIPHLDLQTAIDALRDTENVIPILRKDCQPIIHDRLHEIEKRVANLVAADLLIGNSESWNQLLSAKTSPGVVKMIRDKITFSKVHGEPLSSEISKNLLEGH